MNSFAGESPSIKHSRLASKSWDLSEGLKESFPTKLSAEFTRDSSGRVWNTLAHSGAEEIRLNSTDFKSYSAVATVLACQLSTSASPTTPRSSFSKSKLICLLIRLKSCPNLSQVQLSTIFVGTTTLYHTLGGKKSYASFFPRATVQWNNLPSDIQQSSPLGTFRKKLKLHLNL